MTGGFKSSPPLLHNCLISKNTLLDPAWRIAEERLTFIQAGINRLNTWKRYNFDEIRLACPRVGYGIQALSLLIGND